MSKSDREARNPKLPTPKVDARDVLMPRVRVAAVGVAVALLALGSAWVVRTPAAPQTEAKTPPAPNVAARPDLPGTINGKKNPELIPDEVALRMIVLAVAEPADATDAQKERMRAKLAPMGLSEEDFIAMQNLLADFRAQADEVDKQFAEVKVRAPIPHPDSTDYKLLVDLSRQKDQHVRNAVAALPARLSQEGLVKLSTYLPEVKKGIKILPPMTQ